MASLKVMRVGNFPTWASCYVDSNQLEDPADFGAKRELTFKSLGNLVLFTKLVGLMNSTF